MVKNPPANARDVRHVAGIPRSGRPPGGGHGNAPRVLAWSALWTEAPAGCGPPGAVGPDSKRAQEDNSGP